MSDPGVAAELARELFSEDAAFERLKHDEDCKCHRQIPCRHCVESMIAGAIDTAESVAESTIASLNERCRELGGALKTLLDSIYIDEFHDEYRIKCWPRDPVKNASEALSPRGAKGGGNG